MVCFRCINSKRKILSFCWTLGLFNAAKLNLNTDETPLLHSLMSLWCMGFDSTCVYCRKLCFKINKAFRNEIEGVMESTGGVLKRDGTLVNPDYPV